MKMLLATTDTLPGQEILEVLGLVKGATIQTRHVGSDIMAGLKSLIGGELKGYVKAVSLAREEATARMVQEAEALGADAIVGVRYAGAQMLAGAAEILAYGTAVKLKH